MTRCRPGALFAIVALALLAAPLTAAPLTAEAQQAGNKPVVGVLHPGNSAPTAGGGSVTALKKGLHELGYVVINMRTAKTLGLTIPPSLLLRADQIIE